MKCRARAAPVLVLWMSLLLAGCANLEPLLAEFSGKPPAAKSEVQDEPGPPQADVYALDIVAPEPLRSVLASHLDLARFRDARVAGAVTRLELDRLVAGAPAQARTLAETEGFFDAQVAVTRDRGAIPQVRVVVDPGPRARVDRLTLGFEGALQEASEAGDAGAQRTKESISAQWTLAPGEAFTQSAWSSAKSNALARLQGAGYPLARWTESSATVDTATHRVSLELVVDSGPLFRIGSLRIVGLSRYDESAAANLLGHTPGQAYTEALLAEWQRHLQRSELFESAVVELLVEREHADAATVLVTLREMPLKQVTAGLGYSTDTGPRMTLDAMHRRPFDWNLTATSKLEIGGNKYAWTGQLISHALPGRYRDLISAGAERLDINDELRTSANLRLGRTQDSDAFARQYYFELQRARVESAAPTTSATAATLNYNWVTRRIDSITLPTRGEVLAVQTAGGYAFDTTEDSGAFARAIARVTAYRPLGQSLNVQGYVELGQVFARSNVGIPDTLLFRVGGQDSVRGYGYRTLGPVVDGVVTSGRMVFTSSVELAGPFSDRFPTLWAALFVDAGNAANQWSQLRPAVGLGPGLRWRSPVGALRVDLAYGVDVHTWRLEVSLGIAP